MGRLSDEDYRFIYNQVPRVCIDLLIRNQNKEILLTLRNIPPYKNLWHLPGGGIKFKETFQQAASRIAQNEFGVDVRLLKVLGPCEVMNDDLDSENPRHSISIVHLAELCTGTPHTTSETAGIRYFATIPDGMHPYHGDFLKNCPLPL